MKNSPRRDLEVDPVDRSHVAVALAQPGDADVDLSLRRHERLLQELEPAFELVVRDRQRGRSRITFP